MNRFLDDVDALFGAAPQTAPSGSLNALLELLGPHASAFIADRDGRVLAVDGAADLTLVQAAADWLTGADPGQARFSTLVRHEQPAHATGIRVQIDDAPRFVGGVAPAGAAWPDWLAAAWPALAEQAVRVFEQHREAEAERCRIRQLLAEQESLSSAHQRTVSDALREREERLQEKLAHIDELESEVERRSMALREALQKAEEANRSKSDFLANMSHEIRTPMTAILGFTETLLDDDLTAEERADAIATIQRNGKQLLALINDILDLSKIEAGRLVIEKVDSDLLQIVNDVHGLLANGASAKGIVLEVDLDPAGVTGVVSDPTRLRQILINLAGNAIKFTNRGSVRIRLRQTLIQNAAGARARTLIEVIDSGIGMTPEQTQRLFQPFMQADTSVTRRYGGTGLGLAISLRLARALDGSLTCQSTPGHGSTFRFEFEAPTARLQPAAAAAHTGTTAANPGPALTGVRLLLAEDGPDNQRLISAVLRKAGAHVTLAENGRIACDTIYEAERNGRPFSVVLMDMQMPVLDGYSAAAELRGSGYRRPVIALTAHAMAGDREKCLAAGCTDFATKPINRTELIDLIRRCANQQTPAQA